VKGWPPRYCAECGTRVEPFGGEASERRRCPACGWVFYANPVPAAVAVITRADRILLTRRAHPPHAGTWDLPGGFLEADEDGEAGLARELREELGVRVRRARLIVIATDRYGPGGFPILTLIYRVTPEPGPLRPADDVSEARWFPRVRIPYRQIAFPAVRRALRAWLARSRRRRALTPASGR
jgi:ADP-ribose pyrophosphatase YjhB (NUDIX family)